MTTTADHSCNTHAAYALSYELWERAQEKARRRHETVSAVLVRALLAYVEEES